MCGDDQNVVKKAVVGNMAYIWKVGQLKFVLLHLSCGVMLC